MAGVGDMPRGPWPKASDNDTHTQASQHQLNAPRRAPGVSADPQGVATMTRAKASVDEVAEDTAHVPNEEGARKNLIFSTDDRCKPLDGIVKHVC